MRKTSLVTLLSCSIGLSFFVAAGLPSLPALAQDAAPATVAAKEAPALMPNDAKELMMLAAKSNGLIGADVQPWHLKATYTFLDDKGKVTNEGTYEELWAGPAKFKRSYTEKSFTHIEYGTDMGILLSGDPKQSVEQQTEIRNEFVDPLPSPKEVQPGKFALNRRQAGNIPFNCLNQKNANGDAIGSTWCLDTNLPVLRINIIPHVSQFIHSRILNYEGHYIAGDLQQNQGGKVAVSAHLDSLEPLAAIKDADFAPAANAVPYSLVVSILPDVAQELLVTRIAPEYPAAAQATEVQGTVVLRVTIGKDGHLTDVHVVSGPDMLQKTALSAVKQWVYTPYRVNGEPVSAQTWVKVAFPN